MSTVFMTHALRQFPGLITRDGRAARGERLTRMLDILEQVWAAGFDEGPVDPAADIEDFWEDAVRIATTYRAALDAGRSIEPRSSATHWSSGDLARRMGPLRINEHGGYHGADAFEELLAGLPLDITGRTFAVCTYDTESVSLGADDLAQHLTTLAAAGHTAAVVKVSGHKQGIARIELDPDTRVINRRLHDAFDWTMVRLDGVRSAFLVSPWIEMTYEYRVFVVDGIPVTGAGCIEEYTPLDHSGSGPFDPAVRLHRGNSVAATVNSAITHDSRTVRMHLAAAAPVIAHMAARGLRTYVVDMAYVPDRNDSVVVEFNSMPNAGLYACDAQALARALIQTEHKGYYEYTPTRVR